MIERAIGHILHPIIRRSAVWIFDHFPQQRRKICIGLLIVGFALALPFPIAIWSGRIEELSDAIVITIASVSGTGFVLLLFALFLIVEINRMGEPDERI